MKKVSIKRLEEIVDEMFCLSHPEEFFLSDSSKEDFAAVDNRLQEVMQTRHQYECMELGMYLRTTFSKAEHLPSWQPLLNAAIEQAKMNGEHADDIFYGIMPSKQMPARNTGNPIKQKR